MNIRNVWIKMVIGGTAGTFGRLMNARAAIASSVLTRDHTICFYIISLHRMEWQNATAPSAQNCHVNIHFSSLANVVETATKAIADYDVR
jgi:hypothetical protein